MSFLFVHQAVRRLNTQGRVNPLQYALRSTREFRLAQIWLHGDSERRLKVQKGVIMTRSFNCHSYAQSPIKNKLILICKHTDTNQRYNANLFLLEGCRSNKTK